MYRCVGGMNACAESVYKFCDGSCLLPTSHRALRRTPPIRLPNLPVMARCPVCDAKVPESILDIHVNQCIDAPGMRPPSDFSRTHLVRSLASSSEHIQAPVFLRCRRRRRSAAASPSVPMESGRRPRTRAYSSPSHCHSSSHFRISKGTKAKVQESKRVDSRPEHLKAKTRQHTGALQQILSVAEVDKRNLKEAQAREREEAQEKKAVPYTFGLPDDVLLLVLPHLDARSLTRTARVRSRCL